MEMERVQRPRTIHPRVWRSTFVDNDTVSATKAHGAGSVLEEIAHQVAGKRRPARRLAHSQPLRATHQRFTIPARDNAQECDRPAADLHTGPLIEVHGIAPAREEGVIGQDPLTSGSRKTAWRSASLTGEDRSYANAAASVRYHSWYSCSPARTILYA